MTGQAYDFAFVGMFSYEVRTGHSVYSETKLMWECQTCFALVNHPVKHWHALHWLAELPFEPRVQEA